MVSYYSIPILSSLRDSRKKFINSIQLTTVTIPDTSIPNGNPGVETVVKGAVNVAKLPMVTREVLSRVGAGTGARAPSMRVTVAVIRSTLSVGRAVMPMAAPALIRILPMSNEKPARPPVKARLKEVRLKGANGAAPAGNGRPPVMNSNVLMITPIEMEARPPPRSTWVQVNSNLGRPKLKPKPPKKAPPKPRNFGNNKIVNKN